MKIGITINTMMGDFQERCDFAEKNFDFMELSVDATNTYEIENFKTKLPITIHLPFRGVVTSSMYEKVRKSSIETINEIIEFGKNRGARLFTLHPITGLKWMRYEKGNEKIIEASKKSIFEINEFAKKVGVTLAIENMSNETKFNTPEELKMLGASNVCFDACHAESCDYNSSKWIKQADKIGLKIKNIHLSGYDGGQHKTLKKNQPNLEEMFKTLKEIGYDGGIVFEIKNISFDELLENKKLVEKFI